MLDSRPMSDAPTRYPDPAIHVLDPSFAKYRIANAGVERLATLRGRPRKRSGLLSFQVSPPESKNA